METQTLVVEISRCAQWIDSRTRGRVILEFPAHASCCLSHQPCNNAVNHHTSPAAVQLRSATNKADAGSVLTGPFNELIRTESGRHQTRMESANDSKNERVYYYEIVSCRNHVDDVRKRLTILAVTSRDDVYDVLANRLKK